MFCSPTICFHRGMIHSSAGFTIVTNPSSNETALKRPAFLSDVFLELNTLVDGFVLILEKNYKPSFIIIAYLVTLINFKFTTT